MEGVDITYLEPGDVVLVKVEGPQSQHTLNDTRDRLMACFPGHKVIVLDDCGSLEIVRRAVEE